MTTLSEGRCICEAVGEARGDVPPALPPIGGARFIGVGVVESWGEL